MKDQLKDLQQMMRERSKQIAEEKNGLMDLIGPWLDQIEKSKYANDDKIILKKELNELGKFIVSSKRNIAIDKVDLKSPKFIVSRNRSRVAVELFDMNSVNNSKFHEEALATIFKEVEAELMKDETAFKGVYNIEFKENVDVSESKEPIVSTIIEQIKSGSLTIENDFVQLIEKTAGETVYIQEKINEEGVTLLRSEVESVIASKEDWFEENLKGIQSQWLILVLGGVQDINDYAFLENDIISNEYNSSYDKVFLFDSFSEDIIELK